MVFFESYLLCSYNKQIGKLLLVDCKCYDDYKDETLFTERVINERKSYLACIASETSTRKRIGHRSVPIMLGSYIDYRVRGKTTVEKSRAQWGAVILNGMLKIYTSFSTFDALSMHVRETNERKSIDWYTYLDGEGLELHYYNKNVEWSYKHNVGTVSNEWINFINKANPFVARQIQSSEYTNMFDKLLQHPYNMNDLKNRQFLNGVTIIRKYIEYDACRRKRNNGTGCVKLSLAFESGSLYTVLSKRNTYETEEWCKRYPQSYDNTLHEGRSNKTAHFLQNVTRASNEAFKNSKALVFPVDAFNYFCVLNTKDLKSVGEQNVLADFVIMTEESEPNAADQYLRKKSVNRGHHMILNGFITDCKSEWSFQDFLEMKRELPHVTSKNYEPYILLSTKGSIPIKYSDEHDVYFSPAETSTYDIRYPETSMLSLTAQQLSTAGLRKSQPAKSTVAINNIKGSIAMKTSDFHEALMKMSLGTTCYMDITEAQRTAILNRAIISYGNDTTLFRSAHEELLNAYDLSDDQTMRNTDVGKAMKSLLKMYNRSELFVENRIDRAKPYVKERVAKNSRKVDEYLGVILGAEQYKTPEVWNLRLWAAFGNRHGACVEDGVVLDRKAVEAIPPIVYNACITVDFTFKTAKRTLSASFVPVNEGVSEASEDTLVGCLISEVEVYVKNSRHCHVTVGRIGNHLYYLLHFLPKKHNTYSDLKVRCIRNAKVITVVITGTHKARVGVGTKVANSFGQKNICSLVDDLSYCWGVTGDGRKVHAQIIYSDTSIIGRIASGQMYDMLSSSDLAFGPNKEIIAPVDLVIHSLHPYTNMKVFDVKVDTLTNINGFDSQALASTSLALRHEKVLHKALQVIGLHGYAVDLLSPDQSVVNKVSKHPNNDQIIEYATVRKRKRIDCVIDTEVEEDAEREARLPKA